MIARLVHRAEIVFRWATAIAYANISLARPSSPRGQN